MPDINASTPRENYTIAGKEFSVLIPYAAGDVLNANEAATLNQTWAENARNNFAKKVKEAVEGGTFDQDSMQLALDDYLETYQFGVRASGGGRVGDPILAEALSITKDRVRDALVKKGAKLKDYKAGDITDMARQVLARNDDKANAIMELARQRVEAAKALDDDTLDIGGLEPALVSEEAPVAKVKKGAAAPAEA